MRPLTDKQREYIGYMLTNSYTDEKDQKALEDFMKLTGKNAYTDLTVSEATKLIIRLIERDVEYTFVCGEKKTIERWEAHSFDTMGESKACLNHCPKGLYIGSCEDYQKYETDMNAGVYDDSSS